MTRRSLAALWSLLVLMALCALGTAVPASAVPYPPTQAAALSASAYDPCAGASNVLGGTGFQPGETVDVVLIGSGTLGTPAAASDGTFQITVTIPLDARGAQRVVATGRTSGLSASVALDIPCVLGQSASQGDGGVSSSGGLAFTGAAVGGALLLGALLLGTGGVLLVVGRRRRGLPS